MPAITGIPPLVLRDRHRLSPQQINMLYGYAVVQESYEEKAGSLAKTAEFLKVTGLFRDEGLVFVPLKGPLLSYRLYGDSNVRKYGDIDLLLNPEEVGHARNILLNAGYREYKTIWPETEEKKKKAIKYWHHILFRNAEADLIIELHWRLSNIQWFNFRDTGWFVRENLCTVEFYGNSYSVLTPEAELLYLVIHGGAHRWGMLKWLVDIQRYLEVSDFDRERFCNLVSRLGCGRLVALCNRMLAEFLPGNSLLPCESRMPRYMERSALEAAGMSVNRGPETLLEILHNLPYMFIVYPGLKYKFKVLGLVAGSSFFNGRLRRIFD